jgi:tripartite-type tricarboxylate transporter receptor subunit TctC
MLGSSGDDMQKLFTALAIISAVLAPLAASAQDKWPSRNIRLVVPFAPGGNTDAVARIAAEYVQKALGVSLMIDNRGGAGGIIGADAVAKAAPDGYTLCMCSIGAITIAPATEKLPYDPLKDLAPVSLVTTNPLVLLVNPALGVKSLAEFMALARSKPDGLNYSSSGVGGLMYFSAELFKAKTGVKLTHVPYRGGAPATAAVLSGEVQAVFTNMSDAVGQIEGGALIPLAVTTAKRSPAGPNIPTLAEQGLQGFNTESWNALMAPKGTPREIIDRLAAVTKQMVAEAEVQKKMSTIGSVAVANTPEEFAKQLQEETKLWADLVKQISEGDKK